MSRSFFKGEGITVEMEGVAAEICSIELSPISLTINMDADAAYALIYEKGESFYGELVMEDGSLIPLRIQSAPGFTYLDGERVEDTASFYYTFDEVVLDTDDITAVTIFSGTEENSGEVLAVIELR